MKSLKPHDVTRPLHSWPDRVMSRRSWLILTVVILLMASIFRIVALQDVPPGLAQDEVLNADIVTFIRGGEHAFFFRYGFGHEPLYHYWSVPFQILLGDNVLSIRLPAIALGLLLIAATMRWSRRDFGIVAALAAGLGLAISWWPVIFSRLGLRPIMEPLLLVFAALLWPFNIQLSMPVAMGRSLLAGLVLGLSLYTYSAAWVVGAIPALYALASVVLALWYRRNKSANAVWSRQTWVALVALLTMIIVSLPLMVTLRTDPSLRQRVEQLQGPVDALLEGNVEPVLQAAVNTLGVFAFTGDPRWTYSLPGRPLFGLLSAVLFMVGLILILWRWKRPVYLYGLIWLAVTLLPSVLTPDSPSTVRLVGAMPMVYLIPGLAVSAVEHGWRHRWTDSQTGRVLGVIIVTVIILSAVTRTLGDGFIKWPASLVTRLKYQTVFKNIGQVIEEPGDLLSASAYVVADGFFEPIDAATLDRNMGKAGKVRWVQSGAEVSGAIVWPVRGASDLTISSQENSILLVPEYAAISPDLLTAAGIDEAPLVRSEGKPSFAAYALSDGPMLRMVTVGASFKIGQGDSAEGELQLLAYGQKQSTLNTCPINGSDLYTYWLVQGDLPEEYDISIFVHLLDADGNVVAQHDGLDAAAPTLQQGDRVLQRHRLTGPMPYLPGDYSVIAGLYDRSSGDRFLTNGRQNLVVFGDCFVTEK